MHTIRYTFKRVLITSTIITLMWACCNYSSSISEYVKDAINTCLLVIVPSMYGFMIVSDLFIKTNVYKLIGKILSKVTKKLLNLNGELFAIFLISNVAGYPIGAKLIASLEANHKIPSRVAKNMYCYCYCSGLAFIMGMLSKNVADKNALKVSLIVYGSNVISNLILCVIINSRLEPYNEPINSISVKLSSKTLIDSINGSFKVLCSVCTMIVSFSIVISILESTGFSRLIYTLVAKVFNFSLKDANLILNSILEVSRTTYLTVTGILYLPIVSALLSFGGICVVLQIVSIADSSFNLVYFLKCRMFTSMSSFVICYVLVKLLLKQEVYTYYMYATTKISQQASIVPSLCLLGMSFILLSTQRPKSI